MKNCKRHLGQNDVNIEVGGRAELRPPDPHESEIQAAKLSRGAKQLSPAVALVPFGLHIFCHSVIEGQTSPWHWQFWTSFGQGHS